MVLIGCAITMEGVLTNHVWAHRRRILLGLAAKRRLVPTPFLVGKAREGGGNQTRIHCLVFSLDSPQNNCSRLLDAATMKVLYTVYTCVSNL